MDFDKILDAWEKKEKSRAAAERGSVDMQSLVSRYPPGSEAAAGRDGQAEGKAGPERKRKLRSLGPQAVIDLHGLNSLEAEEVLDRFLRGARNKGLEKVLIVHGKGNHSLGGAVLPGLVQAYLEKCPYSGAFGRADRKLGGRGATWVTLRHPK